jgi:hypothetical protein
VVENADYLVHIKLLQCDCINLCVDILLAFLYWVQNCNSTLPVLGHTIIIIVINII